MKKIICSLFVMFLIPVALFASKTHTIKLGDTFWDLTAKYYGDPSLYTILMEVNGVSNPRVLECGKVIIIPDKSDMERISNEKDASKRKELINKIKGGNNNSDSKPSSSNNEKENAQLDLDMDDILDVKTNFKTINVKQ